jgi:oligopeptide/dipeptide ABC transporter ATP-binding protein
MAENTSSVAPTALLELRDLHVAFRRRGRRKGPVAVIDGVTFTISSGETVGLVGESGSGKSTIGRAVLGLAPTTSGSIRFDGVALDGPDADAARAGLQVVFQDPYGSLNPARKIGDTLREALHVRHGLSAAAARARVDEMLRLVGLPADAGERLPIGFSGGQRQRIGIARALAGRPRLVVCDESTSALDLITRASVMQLLANIQDETQVAYLFIAHDLPLVTTFADRVVVLYRGRVMEQGPARAVGENPLHPYSRALIASVPTLDVDEQKRRRDFRRTRRTSIAEATTPPPETGCPFAPRCPEVMSVCWSQRPRDLVVDDRIVACHLFDPEIPDELKISSSVSSPPTSTDHVPPIGAPES